MASNTVNLSTYKAKILSNTYGANNKPIYFNDGVPTILTTIGKTSLPVWVDNGVIKTITSYEGNADTATTASYLSTPSDYGYSTDDYGNFICKNTTDSACYWHLDNNGKTVSSRYYWDTGDLYLYGKLGIGYNPTTSGNTYSLYVNGTSYFNGNTTHNGIDYFANGTTYYINNSGTANLYGLTTNNTATIKSVLRLNNAKNDTIIYYRYNNNTKDSGYFGPVRSNPGDGDLYYDTRFRILQYSYNSSSKARLDTYEYFDFPTVTADRTSSAGYSVRTSKSSAYNVDTASKWQTARTLTVGATGKSVDGSGNVSWSMNDIMGSSDSSKFYRGDKTWSNDLVGSLNLQGNLTFSNSGTAFRGINYGTMGDNDQWRIGGAATAANAGYMEIATADDGTEPIYVRQYTGVFSSLTRTLTLLDGSGHTTIPGRLYISQPNDHRRNGIVGTYNYQRAAAIWAMGDSYQIAEDGTGLGSLYGAAYGYGGQSYLGSNAYAGGHQFLWCENGGVWVALGEGIWTKGAVNISSNGSARATVYIRSGTAVPMDLWLGSNNTSYWSISCRESTNPWMGFYYNGSGKGWALTMDTNKYVNVEVRLSAPWLRVVNNSSNNSDDAVVYLENKSSSDWGMKINCTGYDYGLNVVTADNAANAIYTNGNIRCHTLFADLGTTAERQIGVDDSTAGRLYLWSNTSEKGLYSSSGYRTGYIIRLTSSATTFYGALSGNADSATTASRLTGFSSSGTSNAGWGNQTGTQVCWANDASGGSYSFRRDNPSSGKLSLEVDGRFYGNEGNYPAMLLRYANGYWGMGNPDAADDWIRTTASGIIPNQGGGAGSGHCGLGTSTWYFSYVYADNFYGRFNGTADTLPINTSSGSGYGIGINARQMGPIVIVNIQGTTTSAIAANTVLRTLPEGYRPLQAQWYNGSTGGGAIVRFGFYSNGQITTQGSIANGTNVYCVAVFAR